MYNTILNLSKQHIYIVVVVVVVYRLDNDDDDDDDVNGQTASKQIMH